MEGTIEVRPLVLRSFRTTVMEGQVALVQRACHAIAAAEAAAILIAADASDEPATRVLLHLAHVAT
jgi:hypothetical protein